MVHYRKIGRTHRLSSEYKVWRFLFSLFVFFFFKLKNKKVFKIKRTLTHKENKIKKKIVIEREKLKKKEKKLQIILSVYRVLHIIKMVLE